jgi:Flp pilus assembly protein TadD
VVLLVGGYLAADYWIGLPADAQATYVGRQSCVQCHQQETHRFTGSYHDKAMDLATEETVLGDFSDAELEHHGITSRMFRRDGKYFVNTEGPDGEMADFEVKYVFGVDPLQQYMVEFDRPANAKPEEIGRLQVLRISWDTHKKRWFHLDPPDVKEKLSPSDDLHWTGISQRWNTMCADCHSTNLKRNFDVATAKYHTTFSEIDVSCEACHGPASLHVEMANTLSPFWDRVHGYGLGKLKTPQNVAELETCAQCHSRRRIVHADFRPGAKFHDFFATETLHRTAYHADGSNLDEVYEYGSFTQSKMFHKNIRCSDCHDPHSTKLHFSGNKVCTSCHQHPASKYDTPEHHHHKEGSKGASCVECHMPESTYMDVDPRRDHGLRIPRPDLSVKYGTPNACTGCHLQDDKTHTTEQRHGLKQYADWLTAAKKGDTAVTDAVRKLDEWCAAATATWYKSTANKPPRKEDKIVPALVAARTGHPSSQRGLADLVVDEDLPAIVRATAVAELGPFARPNALAVKASIAALKDTDPQVRAAALANLEGLEAEDLREYGVPLLTDPVRSVRVEAARVLARIANTALRGQEHQDFEAALAEYFAGLNETNDLVGSHMARGTIYDQLGDLDKAEQSYRTAMRLDPNATGPRSNLAALLERRIEIARTQAGQLMQQGDREAAVAAMDPVAGHQAIVDQLRQEELVRLERDAKLAPDNGPLQHRLGLLLYLLDRTGEAEQHLTRAVELEPNEAHFRLVLALFLEKQQKLPEALKHAKVALDLWPDDEGYQETVARLEALVGQGLP